VVHFPRGNRNHSGQPSFEFLRVPTSSYEFPIQAPSSPPLVQPLLSHFTDLWWASPPTPPALGPTYTARDQAAREARLERFLAGVTSELDRPPHTSSERSATQERIFSACGTFARSALDFEPRHLDVLFSRGFTQALTAFAQAARRFDPALTGSDVFQAGRNVSAMNGLQLLFGQPVELTPAIFAYSLLYPYTDNYLDDPTLPAAAKSAFNERLARRLAGEDVAPDDDHARTVYDLVGLLERQFERARYPQVFDSLLAIHRAQEKSVRLLRRHAPPYEVDVLGISFEKGGTSVLADGCLVAGSLTRPQAEFLFGWGAFLQLADDLQDVQQDHQDGLLTVFSQTAGRWPLDELTNRTFHFGAQILERLDCFNASGADAQALQELMKRSGVQLLVDAAGRANRFHTRRYARKLEAHSPFRFSFLARVRRKIARQRASLTRMVEAFAAPDNVDVVATLVAPALQDLVGYPLDLGAWYNRRKTWRYDHAGHPWSQIVRSHHRAPGHS